MSLSMHFVLLLFHILIANENFVLLFCFVFCTFYDFWLDSSHCKFYLLGAIYFYILINILEHCSGMQLSYLEAVWSLWILFYYLLGERRIVFSLWLIILLWWGETLLVTLVFVPWIMGFSSPPCGNRHNFWPCVSPRTVTSHYFL